MANEVVLGVAEGIGAFAADVVDLVENTRFDMQSGLSAGALNGLYAVSCESRMTPLRARSTWLNKRCSIEEKKERNRREKGVTICCGLARPRYLAGAKPAQVTASHGPGIETCSQCGNVLVDA